MSLPLPDAALRYARHGWPVFPCRARGKKPVTDNGFHAATTDENQVARWWTQTPMANVGFCPGKAGLLVLDWDSEDGRLLAQELGCYSEPGPTVITARGEHLYFRKRNHWIGNRKLGGVLDVRADGGYVLLAPSVHPSGHVYRWAGTDFDFPDLPPKVWNLLQEKPPPAPASEEAPPVQAGTPRRQRYVQAAIEQELLALATAVEGTRNNALNVAAFSLGRFVETGEVDLNRLVDVLTFAARHAGLADEETTRTIDSAFRARGVAT